MPSNRKKAYLALIAVVILWGIAPPLVKLALPYTTPFRWLFYRYLIAAPLSLPLLIYLLAKYRPSLKHLCHIVILELVGTTAVLAALYEGLKLTSATEASLISAAAPVFVVLGGLMFLKEKQSPIEWIGLSLSVAGTTVLTLEPMTQSYLSLSGSSLTGNALIILQNLLWAAYLIIAKKTYQHTNKLLITSLSFWVGLISFYFLSLLNGPIPLLAELSIPIVTISAIYMATLGSIIAATLYLYGQNLIEASEASLFNYLMPLVSLPLAMWWLHEKITLVTLLSAIAIAIGVYLAETKNRQPKI